MKVVGLITEYNPFHNGHKYHIEEAKRITGADYVIAVMSGDYVQRGTPAIIDKYSRTRMALNNGVDLVIELPVCYATGSAEYFAHGAVALLNSLQIVDYLCFGSEAGDIRQLNQAVELLLTAPSAFDENLRLHLKEGNSYPSARHKALKAVAAPYSTDDPEESPETEFLKVLNEPNNILGIEYLKAINKLNTTLQPVTIKREAASYHETSLSSIHIDNRADILNDSSATSVISSATSIRKAILNEEVRGERDLDIIRSSVPADVFNLLVTQFKKTYPITEESFAQVIKYRLLTEDNASLSQYLDITGDLADRMKNLSDLNLSIAELAGKLKTKNMTLTRINRALLHILLNIQTKDIEVYKLKGFVSYVRILGMKRQASPLMKQLRVSSRLPLITKVADAVKVLDADGLRMLSSDIIAAHLYNQAVYEAYQTPIPDEYRHGIIMI